MRQRYVDLVHAYVRDGREADLAAIGDLRESLIENEAPIEDLVGMHEHAMLALKDMISSENFAEVVTKTSTCFTELAIAYSLADQKKKSLLDREQRINRERQRLESLGQIAGGVAHEFNNLLQPIMGMTLLALEDADPGSELADQLGVVLDCANQAATIVRGVLSTARKQGPAPSPGPFAPLLRQAVHFLSAILPREIKLDLSTGRDDEFVLCEAGELSQVLLNLVRNAGDAMGGRGTVEITLQSQERRRAEATSGRLVVARCLRLVVADHGVGMTAEVAAQAFQPFFTTKSSVEGTGLGLSIALAIVHGWNGTVEIDTAPGAGTRVSIVLPVIEGQPGSTTDARAEVGST
jgi:signal transduction histidine kinase